MPNSFIHIYKQGTGESTFCLFHGTGGSEHDLVPYAAMIDPEANLLSLRGNVNENGMNRFFKRIAEGIFDEQDIIFQSGEIANFLKNAEQKYGFNLKKTIFLGYSNGANIAASILLLHPEIVHYAILLRPMLPLVPKKTPNLKPHSVLILAGKHDSVVPQENTTKLVELYRDYQADVQHFWIDSGHGLTEEDLEKAKLWYEKTKI